MGNTIGLSRSFRAVPLIGPVIGRLTAAVVASLSFGAAAMAQAQCIDPVVQTVTSDERRFEQIRKLAGTTVELISTGTASFSEDQILWQVEDPLLILTKISAAGITQSVEGGPDEPVAPGDAGTFLRGVGLADLLRGDLSRVDAIYEVAQQQDSNSWALTLTPKDKDVASYVSTIEMAGCAQTDSIVVTQTGGDVIAVTFLD